MKRTQRGEDTSGGNKAGLAKDIDDYLASVPEPARSTLQNVRAVIRSVVPLEATEAIWYRMPTFKYKGALVSFAAFTNHCSLFLMSPAVMKAFEKDLREFHTSAGTIRFPMDEPLPAELIKVLVKARIAENDSKKSRRR